MHFTGKQSQNIYNLYFEDIVGSQYIIFCWLQRKVQSTKKGHQQDGNDLLVHQELKDHYITHNCPEKLMMECRFFLNNCQNSPLPSFIFIRYVLGIWA